MRILNFPALLTVPFMLIGLNAYGQATRTWVSGVGDDVNPCSRTAPCKTFAGAISKTAAGGEINVIDPGGYGAVTITKSITIDGRPMQSSILASGFDGVIVNAPNATVILRGLSINGTSVGTTNKPIKLINAKSLIVDECKIQQAAQRGISIEPTSANVSVFISNTTIQSGVSNGIVIAPTAPYRAQVTLDNVNIIENANFGLSVVSGGSVVARHSTISGNGFASNLANIRADGTATIDLNDVLVSGSATGIIAVNGGTVRVSDSQIVGNTTGMSATSSFITTYQNNVVANTGGNTFTGSALLQ